MKLPFREEGKPSGAIQGAALEEVFDELCDRKQAVLLATPYLHYESRFLEREGPELRVRATMSRDAVKHALAQHPLRLRFGWALTFFSGPTRILRYVQEEDRRYLRIELPAEPGGGRAAPDAAHRPGGPVLGSPRQRGRHPAQGLPGESLAPWGPGSSAWRPSRPEKFQTGRPLDLSLSLEGGFPSSCAGRRSAMGAARASASRSSPPSRDGISRGSWSGYAPRRRRPDGAGRTGRNCGPGPSSWPGPRRSPSGVLLLSSRPELAAQVAVRPGGAPAPAGPWHRPWRPSRKPWPIRPCCSWWMPGPKAWRAAIASAPCWRPSPSALR